jgi:hypothetical protein
MPILITIKCDGNDHRVEFSLDPGGRGRGKILDHPSLEMLAGFAAFGASKPACLEALELLEQDPEVVAIANLEEFLEQMKHVQGRMAFFGTPDKKVANQRLEQFLQSVLIRWINLDVSERDDSDVEAIGNFITESADVALESDENRDDIEDQLTPIFTEAIGYALEADDEQAVDTFTSVTSDIEASVDLDQTYADEIDVATRRLEATATLNVNGYSFGWDICVEAKFTTTDLENWEVLDCGGGEPDSAVRSLMDTMGLPYDAVELAEEQSDIQDEPERPYSDDEGEFSVWDGDDCLGIFMDYGEAEQFYDMARMVAEREGGRISLKTLAEDALEKYREEDSLDDWLDPDNWDDYA